MGENPIDINFVFYEPVSIIEAVDAVLKNFDAVLYVDNDGKYGLKSLNTSDCKDTIDIAILWEFVSRWMEYLRDLAAYLEQEE